MRPKLPAKHQPVALARNQERVRRTLHTLKVSCPFRAVRAKSPNELSSETARREGAACNGSVIAPFSAASG